MNKFSTRTSKHFNIWRKIFQYMARNIITHIARLKYHILKTEGLENIDRSKKYIIASNHITGFDPFLVGSRLNLTIAYMAKKQLFETFWSSLLMDYCGAFSVDRDKVDISTIKTALSVQKTSWHLGFFPQGTRCHNGKMENVTKGFAVIAKKIKADILPVAIIVTEQAGKKKKNFQIKVGEPIPFDEERNIDDIVDEWGKVISEMAHLEYISS